MLEYKECTKCGEVKSLGEFAPHPQCVGGRNTQCKYCSFVATVTYRKVMWDEDPWLLQAYGLLSTWKRNGGPTINVDNARRVRSLFPSDLHCPVLGIPFKLTVKEPTIATFGSGKGNGRRRGPQPDSPSLEHVLLRHMPGYNDWDNVRVISARANTMLSSSTPADMYIAADWRYNEWKKRGFDKHGNHVGIRHRSRRSTTGANNNLATDNSGGER